jgi:hypothetical protein
MTKISQQYTIYRICIYLLNERVTIPADQRLLVPYDNDADRINIK